MSAIRLFGLNGSLRCAATPSLQWPRIPGFSSQETIRYRLSRPLSLGRGFLQDLDFTIDAQDLRHLPLELGVAIFKIVTHLVRLDFLLTEDLAHRSLDQIGQTRMPCGAITPNSAICPRNELTSMVR